MSDYFRKVRMRFLRAWHAKSMEQKLADPDFKTMLRDLESRNLSLYAGDGSPEFLAEIAAGLAVSRRNIQDTEFLIVRGDLESLMLESNRGENGVTTGVHRVDHAHVLAHGLSAEQLLAMLDSAQEGVDNLVVRKRYIYCALVRLEEEQSGLSELYNRVFPESSLQRLELVRSGKGAAE